MILKAVISRIRARGGKIDREAEPIDALPGAIVGLGRDPDNYVVEVLSLTIKRITTSLCPKFE